jgi:hypothetical protein
MARRLFSEMAWPGVFHVVSMGVVAAVEATEGLVSGDTVDGGKENIG